MSNNDEEGDFATREYRYRPGPNEPKARHKMSMSTYLTWKKMTKLDRPNSWRLPVGLSRNAMQSHQFRKKDEIVVDNIRAVPENINLVIDYTIRSSKINSRHRSVMDKKRRRKTIDLLRIVNQNMELETMAMQIIAAEPMLEPSHLDIVKDAIRAAKKSLLRKSVGLSATPAPRLHEVARQRYQKEVSCMGTSCYLICGSRRVRPRQPPDPRPRAHTPPPNAGRKKPTNARRQYMEDVYGYGVGPLLTHPDRTAPAPVRPRTGRYPVTAFVDTYNDQRLSASSVHRKVLTWPQALPVSKTKTWFPPTN